MQIQICDWTRLTHAATPPKKLNNTILTHWRNCLRLTVYYKCKSWIEVIFYGVDEVLQQDAIDLIYLATVWDYDLPIVELSSSYEIF